MPTFIIVNATGLVMKTVRNNSPVWDDPHNYFGFSLFNKYTSKYQAKRHLKELDNVPEDVKIVELVMEKDKLC